ncbi:hypothetical protein ACJJTC_014070 [Scirpophaga incertulas]
MDDINTEEFINEIEIRPAIWNSKSDKYSNRTETRNAWEGICEKFIEDFQNKTTGEKNSAGNYLFKSDFQWYFKKKWRHIRDAYARDLKKQRESKSGSEAKTKRKYVYFDRLQFLSELYEIKPDSKGKNNQTGDAATASTSKSKTKNSSTNDNDETNTLLKILAERLQNKRNSSEDVSEDGDRYFLLSLLNDFKRIPESRKMDAKYDIIGIIRKYAAPQSYRCSMENQLTELLQEPESKEFQNFVRMSDSNFEYLLQNISQLSANKIPTSERVYQLRFDLP